MLRVKQREGRIIIKLILIFFAKQNFSRDRNAERLRIYGFKNRSSTSSEISFHGLPSKSKRPSIRKQWLAIIKSGGELPKDEQFVICSQHFDEDFFERVLKVVCIYTVRQRCFGNIGCSLKKRLHCLSLDIW